jgi:hypothetical protein
LISFLTTFVCVGKPLPLPLIDIITAFPHHFTSSGSGNRYCVTLITSAPSTASPRDADSNGVNGVMNEKEGEPGADDDNHHEHKDEKDLADEPQSDDQTIEGSGTVIEMKLDETPSSNGPLIILIDILTAVPNHVLLASQLMARYLSHPQRSSSSSDGASLGLMDLHHLVERYPKQLITIGNGGTCVVGLIMAGSSKRSVIEHAKQLSISSMTRENTHEAADVIRELLMSSANYTLTWSQLTGQYRVRLPDGPFVRQVIGLWPNQFHVTDNDNVVTLIMNNNDPLKEEDDEVIISELHDDNDNNDPGGDGSNDGFEHGVNAKQRKKLARLEYESESKDWAESKADRSPVSYRASSAEMKLIVPLWIEILKALATRTLPSLSLCQLAKYKLGIPITNDTVLDIIDRYWDQFVYGGYGSTRVITYIDRSIFTGTRSEVAQAARKHACHESKRRTTREDCREAADALATLLHNAGGILPIDSIGEPIRQQLPDSPLIIRVVELYNEQFALHNRNVSLRSDYVSRSIISKNSVATTESKLPITWKSSPSAAASSDVDFLVNYLTKCGRDNIGGIGSIFKARTGGSIVPFVKQHKDRFVLTIVGSATFVSLVPTASSDLPVSVVSGSSFAAVVAGTAPLASIPIVNATPVTSILSSSSATSSAASARLHSKMKSMPESESLRIADALAAFIKVSPGGISNSTALGPVFRRHCESAVAHGGLKYILSKYPQRFVFKPVEGHFDVSLHPPSASSSPSPSSYDAQVNLVDMLTQLIRDNGGSINQSRAGSAIARLHSPELVAAGGMSALVKSFPHLFLVTPGVHGSQNVSLVSPPDIDRGPVTELAPSTTSSSFSSSTSPLTKASIHLASILMELGGTGTVGQVGSLFRAKVGRSFDMSDLIAAFPSQFKKTPGKSGNYAITLLPTTPESKGSKNHNKEDDVVGEFKSANPAVNEAARIFAEQLISKPDRTMLADQLIEGYTKRTGKPLPVPFLKIMNLFRQEFVIGGFGASRAICLVDSSGLAKAKTRSHMFSKASVTREDASDAVEVVDNVLRDAGGKSLSWSDLGEEYRRRLPEAPFVFPVVQLFPERFHVTSGGMVSRTVKESDQHPPSSLSSLSSPSVIQSTARSMYVKHADILHKVLSQASKMTMLGSRIGGAYLAAGMI